MNKNERIEAALRNHREGGKDALDLAVDALIERDPTFADEWAAFKAGLDLAAKRKDAGLTQADVAARLGIHTPNVARLEKDPSGVSLKRFREYAEAIGYRVELVPVTPANRSGGKAA